MRRWQKYIYQTHARMLANVGVDLHITVYVTCVLNHTCMSREFDHQCVCMRASHG